MKKGNQRQEVLFLGLAVAVLVVVIVLVAVRSAPKPAAKPKRAEAVPVAHAKTAKPQPRAKERAHSEQSTAVELPPAHRDPFVSKAAPLSSARAPRAEQQGKAAPGGNSPSGASAQTTLKLVGVMQSQRAPMAIIYDGDRTYYARPGTRVGDYVLSKIAGKRVVLTKGGEQITLGFSKEEHASRGRSPAGRGQGWQRKRTSR